MALYESYGSMRSTRLGTLQTSPFSKDDPKRLLHVRVRINAEQVSPRDVRSRNQAVEVQKRHPLRLGQTAEHASTVFLECGVRLCSSSHSRASVLYEMLSKRVAAKSQLRRAHSSRFKILKSGRLPSSPKQSNDGEDRHQTTWKSCFSTDEYGGDVRTSSGVLQAGRGTSVAVSGHTRSEQERHGRDETTRRLHPTSTDPRRRRHPKADGGEANQRQGAGTLTMHRAATPGPSRLYLQRHGHHAPGSRARRRLAGRRSAGRLRVVRESARSPGKSDRWGEGRRYRKWGGGDPAPRVAGTRVIRTGSWGGRESQGRESQGKPGKARESQGKPGMRASHGRRRAASGERQAFDGVQRSGAESCRVGYGAVCAAGDCRRQQAAANGARPWPTAGGREQPASSPAADG